MYLDLVCKDFGDLSDSNANNYIEQNKDGELHEKTYWYYVCLNNDILTIS